MLTSRSLYVFLYRKVTGIYNHIHGGLEGKASACNAGDPGSTPELGRSPGEGKWQPTPVFLPGKSHGRSSLGGCSPWSHKELDTTEPLHFRP